jgi:hypothetical protein
MKDATAAAADLAIVVREIVHILGHGVRKNIVVKGLRA